MSAIGAIIGLVLAIFLIIRKVAPVYSLMLGALVGGILGGMTLTGTVSTMISGVNELTPAILRVLAAGVLAGVLIVTGGAESIAETIVRRLGQKHVFLSLAIATMMLTAVGVFVDVAVITIAPIALNLAAMHGISRSALLVMMVGGGKCGNIISPNPNTIIAAENFNAPLSSVMAVNVVPAIVGLLFTVYVIGRFLPQRDNSDITLASTNPAQASNKDLPSFIASIIGPVVAIALLALRPLFGISIDPLLALPLGGLVGIIAMGRLRMLGRCMAFGLEKMSGVAILLIGTGTIAGIIKASTIKDVILHCISGLGLDEVLIAPLSGALMSAATASTTAGATIASSSFSNVIIAAGISGVWGAAMINSGATMIDHLPHGSFFHATGGVTELSISHRLRLVPYESAIGFVLAAMTVLMYLVMN